MARPPTEILWPVRGVDKGSGYQQQAPYSTPSALNVRSYVGGGERRRGGSRPGYLKAFDEQLGEDDVGSPINLLGEVRYVDTTLKSRLIAAAYGLLYVEQSDGSMAVVSSALDLNADLPLQCAEMQQKMYIADHDTAKVYEGTGGSISGTTLATGVDLAAAGVEVGQVVVLHGETSSQNEVIELTLLDLTADKQFILSFNALVSTGEQSNSYTAERQLLDALDNDCTAGALEDALAAVNILGANNVSVTGSNGGPFTITFEGDLAGIDMSEYCGQYGYLSLDAGATVDWNYDLDVQAAIDAEENPEEVERIDPPRVRIVRKVAGGKNTKGIEPITGVAGGNIAMAGYSGTNTPAGLRYSIWRSPKVYDPATNTYAVWQTRFYDVPLPPASETSQGKSPTLVSPNYVDSFSGSPRIPRYKVSDSPTFTSNVAYGARRLLRWRAGDVPPGCSAICLWANRLVLTGSPLAPHAVFLSREGDPLDFDTGMDDAQAAYVAAGPEAGQLGEPGVALLPHSQLCLIIGCLGSMYVMRGNPMLGGQIKLLSPDYGIVGARAWCHAPNLRGGGEMILLYLSHDGLYAIAGECGTPPIPLSRTPLPEDMFAISSATHWVNLAYCPRFRGVFVQAVAKDPEEDEHRLWWFDWEQLAWWPEAIATGVAAATLYKQQAYVGTDSPVLHGGTDGYLRRSSEVAADDDGTPFAWHVDLGPLRLGAGPDDDGILSEFKCELGVGSGPALATIRADYNGEAAFVSERIRFSKTIQAGRPRTYYPRVGDGAAVIRLAGIAPEGEEAATRVSFERILVRRERSGTRRKA